MSTCSLTRWGPCEAHQAELFPSFSHRWVSSLGALTALVLLLNDISVQHSSPNMGLCSISYSGCDVSPSLGCLKVSKSSAVYLMKFSDADLETETGDKLRFQRRNLSLSNIERYALLAPMQRSSAPARDGAQNQTSWRLITWLFHL
jgi:hypothetical protein